MASGNAHIGKPAPDFTATAVVDGAFKEIKLSDYRGKYVVLFFYPLDFTFVCPTEIIAFSDHAEDFRKLGCEVLGVSVDSQFTHLAWINTPRKEGGLGPLNIPLLADVTKSLSQNYGVLKNDEGIAYRYSRDLSPAAGVPPLGCRDHCVWWGVYVPFPGPGSRWSPSSSRWTLMSPGASLSSMPRVPSARSQSMTFLWGALWMRLSA